MAIVSIGELFDRAEAFEHRIERYYARIRDETESDGVRLLTYYLARHRRHLEQALKDTDSDVVAKVRNVQLKYDIDFSPEQEFKLFEVEPQSINSNELLDAAAAYDTALIKLYKTVLNQPIGEEATSIFENLVKVEERDIVMIRKMIAMNYF
jgi:hypothetical protein